MKQRRRIQLAAAMVTVAFAGGCQLIAGLGDLEVICSVDDPNCMPCYGDDDCPPSEPCRSWACVNNRCAPTDKPARVACPLGVCSGEVPSTCVDCVVDEDCGAGAYCTQKHNCGRCNDGIKNGDEGGVDCGGHCLTCLGVPCSSPEECLSGFCADGGCCDGPCDQMCTRCSVEGACIFVPQFEQDRQNDGSPNCDGHYVCNGFGGCSLREAEPCFIDDDCASFKCANGTCTGP